MGGALWKEFYLNILSKLWCSSKILFKQLRWHGFYPLGKRQSKIAKKLRKWEQYEENLFSFKLPSEKFLAIGKNRTACLIKTIPLFLLREHTTVFIEWSGNGLFFQFWWKDATQWWGLEQKKTAEASLRKVSAVKAARDAVPFNQNSFWSLFLSFP